MTEDNRPACLRRNCRLINDESKGREQLSPIFGYAQEPLLSLSDACKPLVDIVDNILYYVSIAIQTTPNHPNDNLTRNESASIRLYTMEWPDDEASLYTVLNRTLRMHDRNNLKPWFKYLKLFLTALAKIPCAQSKTIWRGMRQNVSDAFPCTAEVIWWSFSSCTITLAVLENELYLGQMGKRTLFSIEAINARDVSAHSHFHNEREILLLPGTYMKVESKLNLINDLYMIHLKQEIPNTMLLEPPFEGAHLYPTTKSVSFYHRLTAVFMMCSIKSVKDAWYTKKKYFILFSLLIVACIVAITLGCVLGTKLAAKSFNTSTNTQITTNSITTNIRSTITTASPNTSQCSAAYLAQSIYLTGLGPQAVSVVDVNNDNKPDIIVANSGSGNVGVLLNLGHGTFTAQTPYSAGSYAYRVAVVDVDSDSKPDIVVTNYNDHSVSVLINTGSGTFTAQTTYSTGSGPIGLAVVDVNSDSKLDIIVINAGSNNVGVLFNIGNGIFTSQTTYPTGSSPYGVTVVDVNNDSKPDIIVANLGSNNVGVLINTGSGTFSTQTTYSTGYNPAGVTVVDVNSDSKPDIIVANLGSNNVGVLLNIGDGTFTAQITHSTGSSPYDVAVVDVNSDSKPDIIIANYYDNNVGVLINTGSGTFSAQTTYPTDFHPYGVAVVDVNSDGKPDIIVTNPNSNDVSVLLAC